MTELGGEPAVTNPDCDVRKPDCVEVALVSGVRELETSAEEDVDAVAEDGGCVAACVGATCCGEGGLKLVEPASGSGVALGIRNDTSSSKEPA